MTMPVAASVESLPAIVYRGQPVITTEFLAGMYGAPVENIQNVPAESEFPVVQFHGPASHPPRPRATTRRRP